MQDESEFSAQDLLSPPTPTGIGDLTNKFIRVFGNDLNEQQISAVTAPEKRVLVLAGAGTGKTTVITYRVAYLFWMGVDYRRILLATFTNKAASMMLDRVRQITGVTPNEILGGTFHHIANVFLRRHARKLGYLPRYTILDEDDSRRLLKKIRKEQVSPDEGKDIPSASTAFNIGSLAKNSRRTIEEVINQRYFEVSRFTETVKRLLDAYENTKRIQNLMDFDDLLLNFYRLLQDEELGETISAQFEHVLVDEYQDTNALQVETVKLLSRVHENVFIVGDDAQSIYGFRAASFRNILNVPLEFPGTKIYKLEVNYRSTPEILDLANSILSDTSPEFLKKLVSVKQSTEKPKLVFCANVMQQAQFIGSHIASLQEQGLQLHEIAVLYRSHRHSLEIEEALREFQIAYDIRGGVRFMERAHIKDLLSHLFVLANPRNELAFARMLSLCEKVGPKTVNKVLTQVQNSADTLQSFIALAESNGWKRRTKDSLLKLTDVIKKLSQFAHSASVSEIIRDLYEKYYGDRMKELYDDHKEREEDVYQLIRYAQNFENLEEFLSQASLNQAFSGEDVQEASLKPISGERVTLSTIHQAKGLEWRIVFVTHLTEGELPHRMCFTDQELLEEERRLFYVAVTRAKEAVIITVPQSSEGYSYYYLGRPSRFLRVIPEHLYESFFLEEGDSD